ncbi:MAG: M48 family metallopeptidase [Planctomycetota bacterium]
MPIIFACPECGRQLKVSSKKAGKRGRCKNCSEVIRIPNQESSSSVHRAESLAATLEPAIDSFTKSNEAADPVASPPNVPPVDDPFGQLPAFEAPAEPVAARTDTDRSYEKLLLSESNPFDFVPDQPTHATVTSEQRPAQSPAPTVDLDDLSDRIGGLADQIQSAVHQEQRKARAKLTPQQIRDAFSKPLAKFDRGNDLGARQVFAALAVLLVPSCFIGFVAVSSYLIFKCFSGWFAAGTLPHPVIGLTCFVFAILLLFCWVPTLSLIFAGISLPFRRVDWQPATSQLTRDSQPVMYEFVDQICEKLDAPKPIRIDLDCECNASAGLSGSLFSLKRNLVLTIGIPLIATQTTEQLASVIAHEFGHFRQGAALRTSGVIRSLTLWFVQSARSKFSYYFYFAWLSHWLSGTLSREMEWDADRHSVYLAGTRAFEESSALLQRYGVAHSVTEENCFQLYQQGVLVDNLPRFMVHIGKTMPASVIRRIAESTEKERLDRFDTHPPTRDRVAFARELKQPGILQLRRPATDLIDHWVPLCKKLTLDFYAERIGVPRSEIDETHVTPLENLLRDEHRFLLDLSDKQNGQG